MTDAQEPTPAIFDVTLRDGGYMNDFSFSAADRHGVVKELSRAGIPWLEVGYFAGAHAAGDHPTFPCEEIPALVEVAAGRSRLAVMVHRGTVLPEDYARLARAGIEMIRMPLAAGDLGATAALAREVACIRACGMQVSLNLIRVSDYRLSQILDFAAALDALAPDWLYVADSNGSLFAAQVEQLYLLLAERIQANLGFHAHDSLSLAFANSLAAAEHGARMIDSSLGGMGKRGNLVTELVALYLNLHDGTGYDVESMLRATERFVVPWIGPACLKRAETAIAGILNLNHETMLELYAAARGGDPRPLDLLLARLTTRVQRQREHRLANRERI
jgi:4-hydroxy 2-oxovalerate aldolase